MKRTKTKSIFGALCLFFAISLFSVFLSISFNTVSVSAYSATISTSDSVTLDATINGTGTSIKAESINIQTDCRAGYNLNIATPNGSNLYLNGNNSENASFTAVDGTSALSSSNNTNKWGYTLATNPTSSTVFLPLSANTSVLKTPAQTASPNSNINDTFDINYGVHTDETITPGAYRMGNNGTIVYYLTMDESCMTVNIAYDGNNADAGTMGAAGTGVIHTGVKDGDTIDLIASNFSRTGYGFAGWSTDQNAGAKLTDNDNTNNPIVYGPQETVTLPNGFTNYDTDNDGIVKLYAVWIPSQGNLQGWMGCSSLDTAAYDSTTGALDLTKKSVTALTDQRDNDTYAVARLADGQCWMIENLRLESTNSDNRTGTLAQGYGGQFEGLADAEPAWANNSTTANSLYSTDGSNNTINIGTSNAGYRFPRYNHDNTNSRASSPTTNVNAMYSYGNYYTWHAAVADTTTYTNDNQSVTNTSLCPSGWRLPQGGNKTRIEANDDNDFWNLTVDALNGGVNPANYGSSTTPYYTGTAEAGPVADKLRSYPNNFVYSGYVGSGWVVNHGSLGYYWSSTAVSSSNAYSLYLRSSYVYPGTGDYTKYYGRTVRCVASEPATYTLTYDANGGSGTPSSPSPIYANGSATFTVSNITPTRSGYTFAGWTDEKGNEVQAGGSFTTRDTSTTLYAIWTNNSCNPTATTIGTGNTSTDAVCLQDVTLNMKAALPIATATTGTYNLIDSRDGQSYTVAKLADGNLWLTKNLNYGSSSDMLLTSHDTDLPSNETFRAPASTTAFETADNADTRISPKILTDSTYGGYYSFAAAIASTDAYSTSNQNITTSICPKGWDLPTRTIYNNLRTTSGNTSFAKMSAAPYNFIYAGYKNGTNTPTSQTSALRLWTSTNYSDRYAYYTTAYGTASYSSNYKRYGESIRCIASNGTATISYNANGGAGTMASQSGDINALGTISSNSFTAPANRQFRNWNTKADGTGTTVAAGASVSSIASNGDTITLYAQWDEVYYIAFNANQGTGSMTNQTVVRGTATAIKTSTFTRTGYIFRGWNTAANGTGIFYGDGQKVTNLTTTGNTITLYAVWVEGAYLDTGQTVNQKLKRLAGNSSATSSTQDNTITALVRSDILPDGFIPATANTISDSTSPTPIYAWYDSTNTTIYYYSEATNIIMNKDAHDFFYQMRALSDLSTISTWDTVKVTDMSGMFFNAGYNATTFTLDLSSWDISSVKSMGQMFSRAGYSATTWSVGDLSSWDISSVTHMADMFSSAGYSATTWSVGDLSSWDISSVTHMGQMFTSAGYNATTWSVGDLSSWNTSSVTDMSSMFSNAGYSATTWSVGDLSSWNTSSVTDMSYMFSNADRSATTWSVGDLSSWSTSNVTNMNGMFNAAGYSATTWSVGNLSSWNTSSVTNMSYMFNAAGYSATTWSIGNLSSWNTSSVTSMSSMFDSAGYSASTFTLDLSSWDTSSVTNMQSMFSSAGRSATTWSVGDLSSWDTSSVTNLSYMFYYAGRSATTFTLDLSSWDTSSVTNMSYMFNSAGYSATTWSVGDLSSWNTSSVTTMESMFFSAGYNAVTFTLDLSSWSTSNVKNMYGMFNSAGFNATTWSLGDLSSWNTSSVTNMNSMFHQAGYRATTWSLGDLSSWNTSNVTSMNSMFFSAGINATTFTLDLSSWDTSSVTNMSNMFNYAGNRATTWSVTIPKTNNGTATGPISNITSNLYGNTTSVTATPPSGRSFTLAN